MSRTRTLVIATALGLAATAALAATPAEIATGAGCMACHQPKFKLIGPAFKDIAAKYKGKADAPAALALKVRKGGKGVWGEIAMLPADPAKISDADLKAVIAWILKTPA